MSFTPFENEKLSAHIDQRTKLKEMDLLKKPKKQGIALVKARQLKALERRGPITFEQYAATTSPEDYEKILNDNLLQNSSGQIQTLAGEFGPMLKLQIRDGKIFPVFPTYKQYCESLTKGEIQLGSNYTAAIDGAMNNTSIIMEIRDTGEKWTEVIKPIKEGRKGTRTVRRVYYRGNPGHVAPTDEHGNPVQLDTVQGFENACSLQCSIFEQAIHKKKTTEQAKEAANNPEEIFKYAKKLGRYAKAKKSIKRRYPDDARIQQNRNVAGANYSTNVTYYLGCANDGQAILSTGNFYTRTRKKKGRVDVSKEILAFVLERLNAVEDVAGSMVGLNLSVDEPKKTISAILGYSSGLMDKAETQTELKHALTTMNEGVENNQQQGRDYTFRIFGDPLGAYQDWKKMNHDMLSKVDGNKINQKVAEFRYHPLSSSDSMVTLKGDVSNVYCALVNIRSQHYLLKESIITNYTKSYTAEVQVGLAQDCWMKKNLVAVSCKDCFRKIPQEDQKILPHTHNHGKPIPIHKTNSKEQKDYAYFRMGKERNPLSHPC